MIDAAKNVAADGVTLLKQVQEVLSKAPGQEEMLQYAKENPSSILPVYDDELEEMSLTAPQHLHDEFVSNYQGLSAVHEAYDNKEHLLGALSKMENSEKAMASPSVRKVIAQIRATASTISEMLHLYDTELNNYAQKTCEELTGTSDEEKPAAFGGLRRKKAKAAPADTTAIPSLTSKFKKRDVQNLFKNKFLVPMRAVKGPNIDRSNVLSMIEALKNSLV